MNITTEIARFEDRHPITVALDYGFGIGMISSEQEVALRGDLEDLVAESAEKFVGFQNIESVRRALDITLGILSISVSHTTRGEWNLDTWMEAILNRGLKGLAAETITIVKKIHRSPSSTDLKPIKDESTLTARDLLVKFATSRETKGISRWKGYEEMLKHIKRAEQNQQEIDFALWLIEHEGRQSLSGWLETNIGKIDLGYGKVGEAGFLADEVINNFMFRHCSDLPTQGKIALGIPDFSKVYATFVKNRKQWFLKARRKYTEIRERIPKKFYPVLDYRGYDWFETYLSEGPPKVYKKTIIYDVDPELFQGYFIDTMSYL
jgi:hypothetical protein